MLKASHDALVKVFYLFVTVLKQLTDVACFDTQEQGFDFSGFCTGDLELGETHELF